MDSTEAGETFTPRCIAPRLGALGLLWAGALALRLVHLLELSRTPVFGLLLGDSRGYDLWARTIAAGDWLGKGVFYQAPLYPYFLGTLYTAFGPSLWAVRLAQAGLGATACVLLAVAGEALFDRRTGLVAGALLALWPAAIFFDGLVQKSSLDVFLTCLLLALLGRMARTAARGPWLLLGFVLGCLVLTRENALVLLAVIVPWLSWAGRGRPRPWTASRAALLAAGLLAVLLPVGLRNFAVGGEFHLTTSQFGTNLYIGNNPSATGSYAPLRHGRGDAQDEATDARELAEGALGRRLTAGEVSSFWARQAWKFMVEKPRRWLALLGKKFLLTWNRAEMSDTEDQGAYGEWSHVLALLNPLFHFGVLLPLAAAGMALTWPLRRRVWILWAFLVAYSSSVAIFYVFSRYRLPLVPALLLFAAAALAHLPALVRRRRRVTLALLTALAGGVLGNLPVAPGAEALARALTFHNVGMGLCINGGHYVEAVPYFRRAIALSPAFSDPYYGLANALRKVGRRQEALAYLNQALALQPWWPDALEARGIVSFDLGRWEDAARDFRAALGLDPTLGTSHYGLGQCLLRLGQGPEAQQHLAEAARLDPRYR